MKLLTWNCCLPPWSISRKTRIPKIIDSLISLNPDVICLQEVFFKKDADFIVRKLKNANFIDYFHFKDLFIVSKYSLLEKKGVLFKKQGNGCSFDIFDVLYKKGFQSVKIKNNGNDIFLTNTHLMSAYGLENDLYQKTRKEQVLEIIGILKDYKGIQLLVGDFNFQPDTSPFQEIIKAGFIDPTNKNIKTIKKRRLDYIFLKNLFPNSNTKLVLKDKNFSDHAGLIIEI